MRDLLAVLGGYGGIGRSIVERAREQGYDIVVLDLPASLAAHPPPEDTLRIAVDAMQDQQIVGAASVGASLALLLGVLRKRLTRVSFLESLSETASSTGMIFIIIIGASIYAYFATLSGLPEAAVQGIQSLGLPDWALLAALLLLYLALGTIFDTIAAMVLTLPVVYPLIIGIGYDPIWWGVVNIVLLELGMITPPFGINVFVLHGICSDLPLGQIYRGIVPFLIADILRLGLLVSVPPLSLWLPRHLGWL